MSLSANPAHAGDGDVITFEPSVAWALDYSKDSCALTRAYTAKGEKLYMHMRQYSPSGSINVLFSAGRRTGGKALKFRFGDEGDYISDPIVPITWAHLPGGMFAVRQSELLGVSPSVVPDRQWSDEERDALFSGIETISMVTARNETWNIHTGNLVEPFRALSKCMTELTSHWDIDHAAHENLSRKADPRDFRNFILNLQTYPRYELVDGQEAIIAFRVDVDAQGNGTACHIQNETDTQRFKPFICKRVLGDGLYLPALDSGGNPVKSYWAAVISYKLGN